MPLNNRKSTYDDTKPFARAVAELLERSHPELVVSNMKKELRKNKVLVDWSQNDRHKTTVCVYSLRAKSHPTASTPVTWAEVEKAVKKKDPELLSFTSDEVLKRVDKHGDHFEPVLTLKQNLPTLE
jgi:bifunctional non-homologous end joining protein LigD